MTFAFQTLVSAKQITVIMPFAYFVDDCLPGWGGLLLLTPATLQPAAARAPSSPPAPPSPGPGRPPTPGPVKWGLLPPPLRLCPFASRLCPSSAPPPPPHVAASGPPPRPGDRKTAPQSCPREPLLIVCSPEPLKGQSKLPPWGPYLPTPSLSLPSCPPLPPLLTVTATRTPRPAGGGPWPCS